MCVTAVTYFHSNCTNQSARRLLSRIANFFVRTISITATFPETRACPYTGKFEVSNLIRSENTHQSDTRYYDNNYYVNKFPRSAPDHKRRIKRVDQSVECDSTGFTSLVIGCNSVDTMEFRAQCSSPDAITCEWPRWALPVCHDRMFQLTLATGVGKRTAPAT
jgi:hypothetical protein